jgi:CheY-like chemotaxis protein/two-component sensor histidine kinase
MPNPSTETPKAKLTETEQIADLEQKLECANRSRNEFLMGVNHRFRTPMNGVHGMLELLAESELTDDQHSHVNNAICASRKLMRIFDELMDYCRVEAGELILSSDTFSPQSLIDTVLSEFADEAKEKGVSLNQAESPEVPATIQGDEQRLHQVLFELLENALRHTPEGQVQVGVRPVADEGSESKLLFWVNDTGSGIPQSQIGRLFELDLAKATDSDMRIGLPAVGHILEAMGGTIEVEGEQGSGTMVQFCIPTTANWNASATGINLTVPNSERSRDQDRRAAKVLVVEDDLVNQRVTQGFLKLAGYNGTIVDSGENALKALANEEFDLVLMDKMMPGMDGIGATVAIREGKRGVLNPQIPIIALTAEVSVDARRECLNAGMNDYLTKPIRKKEIDPVIRAWLPPHLRPARQPGE